MAADIEAITRVMTRLADTLVDDFDAVDVAQQLCADSVGILDVEAAGVLVLGDDGEFSVLAASSEEVETLEMFEIQRDEGPCLESHRTGEAVLVESRETLLRQWPYLGALVAEHFASVYAFPMRLRREMVGALSLYGERPKALDPELRPLAQAFADIATISLLQDREMRDATELSRQLQYALTNRVVIEQAKGVFAERHGITVGAAFEALRRHSQLLNTKLATLAAAFVNDEIDLPLP